MATNLRLRPEAAAALKAESDRTGLSQQEILRQAVDARLGLDGADRTTLPDGVQPAERPFRRVEATIDPSGATLSETLASLRDDRLP